MASAGALRGLPLRVVFTPLRRPTYALYAKPEIRTIAELDGASASAYRATAAGPDLLLRDVLKKRMSDGGRKVTILAVGMRSGQPLRPILPNPTPPQSTL